VPNFNNLKDMYAYYQEVLNDTLKDDVYKEVKTTLQKNIQETVYDSYSPKEYQRRGYNDGLIADENIVGELEKDGVLAVKDIADSNDSIFGTPYTASGTTTFAGWVEYGQVSDAFGNGVWTEPRPFMENTKEELKSNNVISKALQTGLKKRGVDATTKVTIK
jgi:hypothetical protein